MLLLALVHEVTPEEICRRFVDDTVKTHKEGEGYYILIKAGTL